MSIEGVPVRHPPAKITTLEHRRLPQAAYVSDTLVWLYSEADAYAEAGLEREEACTRWLARRFKQICTGEENP